MSETIRSERDPSLAKIKLRSEVTHSLRACAGEAFVMVRDPIHSHFYRLGIGEWKIAKHFDGTRTLRQVVAELASSPGSTQSLPSEVMKLANWLVQNRLAEETEGSLRTSVTTDSNAASSVLQQVASLGAWNPLFLKFALPNPQPLLNAIFPWTNWLFSSFCLVVWMFLCVLGCYSVCSQWPRFESSIEEIFAAGQWLHLLLVWLALKVVHELGHAICCMRHGGRVTRWGLMFIMFSPIAWVDVTSAWSFRSKWPRMAVSAAGMYVEFLVAGIAAIVWANTQSPFMATLCRNIVISASVTSVLFNLNVLMRFDGYFILADLLDIQNLYAAGQQYVQYAQRRYLLGMRATPLKLTGLKLSFVRMYGIAAMVWRFVFYVGIVIVAAQLFHGAGLVLAVFSGVLWFGLPLARFCLTLFANNDSVRPNRIRLAAVCSLGMVAAIGVLCLPWPGSTRAHGYVEYAPLRHLRIDHGGFVREVRVTEGDHVTSGQVLVRLENAELTRELADLDLQIRIQEIEQRVMYRDDALAAYAAAREKAKSLSDQRAQLAEQLDGLTLRAPISGTVIARDLDSIMGRYLASGAEVLSVGATGAKEIRICIPQQQVELYRSTMQRPVQVQIDGHRLSSALATFTHVAPRATRHVLNPSLAATAGGPLAVQAVTDSDDASQRLVEPSFEGIVKVPDALSDELWAGEICSVSLGRGRQRVYEKLWKLGRAYFVSKSQS